MIHRLWREPAETRVHTSDGLASSVRQPVDPAVAIGPIGAVVAGWVVMLAVSIGLRPLLPVDETRYASVAWEMWRTANYLVPHLNGVPYSHKPPLLFWLIAGGWWVFGPIEIWARLVGPLSGLASIGLTAALAGRLWPHDRVVQTAAPLILASTAIWAVYSTLLLFDTVLTTFVLLALIGIVEARRGRGTGFVLLALGIGFGILAKGPVVLIHVLPAALSACWWDVRQDASTLGGGRSWRVLLGVGGALLGGAVIALAWAIPAAIAGGPTYGQAILIGQTAGRVVRSFAHRRPLWWYVPNLLWMTVPWIFWPTLWSAARALWAERTVTAEARGDSGLRFCFVIMGAALVVFSLISGKQVHYLLPELPVFALAVARLVARGRAGAAIPRIGLIAVGSLGLTAMAMVVAVTRFASRYDVRPVAQYLSAIEQSRFPIAHEGAYAGQFTYLGRLRKPIAEVPRDSVAAWLERHPNGRVVTYARSPNAAGVGQVELSQRLAGRYVTVRASRVE